MLRHGYRAVLAARRTSLLQSFVDEFPETAFVAELDLTKSEQVAAVARNAEAHFGSIDVLVNNAGVGYLSAIEEGGDEDIRWQFETNFFGPAALIRAVLPGMRERQHGHIINVSSVAGFVSHAGMGYYAASKFAVDGLTEALCQELEPLGIKVDLVEPGGFRKEKPQRLVLGSDAYGAITTKLAALQSQYEATALVAQTTSFPSDE